MRFITETECISWCKNRDFSFGKGSPHIHNSKKNVQVTLSGVTIADQVVASTILSYEHERASPSSEILLWIREWGIFNDKVFQNAISLIRAGVGEARSLGDCPGHVIPVSSIDLIEVLLLQVVLARWDAILVPSIPGYSIAISHDNIIDIYCKDEAIAQQMLSDLGSLHGSKVASIIL